MELCFATNNRHKLEEVRQMLPDFRILSLNEINCREELPETHFTMEENSLEKAAYVFQKYHVPCFADDSGLEVEVLHGAPGVLSARYAGPQRNDDDNVDLLLANLSSEINRQAQFRAVITLVTTTSTHVFEGIVKGHILESRKGQQGFGYDPVFVPEGYRLSFAEMSMAEKNKLSHRALAVARLADFLKQNRAFK